MAIKPFNNPDLLDACLSKWRQKADNSAPLDTVLGILPGWEGAQKLSIANRLMGDY